MHQQFLTRLLCAAVLAPAIMLFSFSSCSKTKVPVNSRGFDLPEGSKPVMESTNQFAFDFFSKVSEADPEYNNKLISPLSIYTALAMVYNGADGGTKEAMRNTLRLTVDIETLNAAYKALLPQLMSADDAVDMRVANSIWYRQKSFQPRTTFLTAVSTQYDASVTPLDFDDKGAVQTINNWVSQKTNEKITTIIETIPPEDLMYIINAVYFNGKWKNTFDKSSTHGDIFHLRNGSTVSVPFMTQQMKVNFFRGQEFTLFELPYGAGRNFSMYVIQPADRKPASFDALLQSLNTTKLQDAAARMDSTTIRLQMPRWEYRYDIQNMKPELEKMGMGVAFGDHADFSKLYHAAETKVRISKAIHKTYIKVDEEGTEAAAVTGIGVGVTSVGAGPQLVRLDHPFLYLIMEKQTGLILFIGVLNNPAVKK